MPPCNEPRRRGSRAPSASSGRTGAWRRRAATSFVPVPSSTRRSTPCSRKAPSDGSSPGSGFGAGRTWTSSTVSRRCPPHGWRTASTGGSPSRGGTPGSWSATTPSGSSRRDPGPASTAVRCAARSARSLRGSSSGSSRCDRSSPRRRPRRPQRGSSGCSTAPVASGSATSSRPSRRGACARSPARSAREGRSAWRSTRRVSRRRSGCASAGSRSPPATPRFAVGEQGVRVVPSRPGRVLDVERIGRSLVSNLESTTHLARFAKTAPALTTEEAEKLDIREPISEFTTYYSCCQPRVTNIQRAAQLLDGTIVRPGEEFSLNGALGKRTVERGFVAAPQIFDGRLEDAVGGGISQVATTLYNAAFFAGVKLVAHQAHQFYISRYPMGREATVSWGGPELIFRNDWPAAILVKVAASDSAITVRFYSRKLGRRVETTTGEPYAADRAPHDHHPERVAPARDHQHGAVVRGLRVHRAVHAEGVQGGAAREERALHRPLRPAERDRRAGAAEKAKPGARPKPAKPEPAPPADGTTTSPAEQPAEATTTGAG